MIEVALSDKSRKGRFGMALGTSSRKLVVMGIVMTSLAIGEWNSREFLESFAVPGCFFVTLLAIYTCMLAFKCEIGSCMIEF